MSTENDNPDNNSQIEENKMNLDVNEDIVSSHESSSDSESDSEDDSKLLEQIQTLKNKLEQNVLDYQSFVDIINAIRKTGNLSELRLYRLQMKDHFPLSSSLWKDWIDDEKLLASTDDERIAVLALYECAIKDYYSISIIKDYILFKNQYFNNDIIEFCEKMISLCGSDVMNGYDIWSTYRHVLKENNKEDQIRSLYLRQLTIPLFYNDEILNEYISWEEQHQYDDKDASIQKAKEIFEKSNKQYEFYLPYEEAMMKVVAIETATDVWNELKHYIEVETKKEEIIRVQHLYEQYCEKCCFLPEFWIEFCKFIYTVLSNSSYLKTTSTRALRNISYDGTLHYYYILSLELTLQPVDKLTKEVQRVMSTLLQSFNDFEMVFLEAFASYRRRINNKEENAQTQLKESLGSVYQFMHEYFANYEDYLYNFDKTCALYYNKELHDSETALSIFESLVKTRSKLASVWQDYVYHDKLLNNGVNVRGIYRKGINLCQDYPDALMNDFLQYEREYGTLETMKDCMRRITKRTQQINEISQQKQDKEKRIQEAQALLDFNQQNEEKNQKNKRMYMELEEETNNKRKRQEEKEKGILSKSMIKNINQYKKNDPSTQKKTIFVTNLPFTMSKDDLEALFKQYGTIVNTNLVCNNKGKSRGFAYIEYGDEKEAHKALSYNGTMIDNRKVEVKISLPTQERSNTSNKKEKTHDKFTVYISNLPDDTDEYSLGSRCKACGDIDAIRVIRDKLTRQSKGYALVQFKTPEGAQNCLKLNKTEIFGKLIGVKPSLYAITENNKTNENNSSS